LTSVIENAFGGFKITEANLSVVVDSIILLRYVELDSRIAKAISILKMRGGIHPSRRQRATWPWRANSWINNLRRTLCDRSRSDLEPGEHANLP
jgi:KaiC/GvpD/RAD55 family RecA-like ATPase